MTMNHFSFSLTFLCILLCQVVLALETCDFPAIFNFGDGNSDTGAYSSTFFRPPPPYGETYFDMPAERPSDGRLLIDFIASSLGKPFISAYLNSLGPNFSHGANFANLVATIAPPKLVVPVGTPPRGWSPFFFDIQLFQFSQFINRSQIIRRQGGMLKDLMPAEESISKALYTIDIGQNDISQGIFTNLTIEEIRASIPDVINRFSVNIKNLYNLGARSFWIHNTGPIGCLPYLLTNYLVTPDQTDSSGCAKPYNELAQYFNHRLKEAVVQLRYDLPLAAITYVDIYSVKYSLYKNPKTYGFKRPLEACCGFGGKYNFGSVTCGGTVTVNGTQIFVGSCKRPSERISWDGINYTDAAENIVFDQISTGAFSDPPNALKMSCHRK